MQRAVEIYPKRATQLWLMVAELSSAGLLVCLHHDELWPLTWRYAFEVVGIAVTGIPGLLSLFRLLASGFRREPYLIVCDDHIDVYRSLSGRFHTLHFTDVKEMAEEDDDDKERGFVKSLFQTKNHRIAVFKMQPYLQKSNLPGWNYKLSKALGTNRYSVPLQGLDQPADTAYDLLRDRYMKYRHLHRRTDRINR